MCHRHLIKPVCVQYGRLFSQKKRLSYPAQQGAGKGFVKGESVPLDPLLVPFGGAKGTPRRRAVQIMITKRLAPPIGDIPLLPNGSRGVGIRSRAPPAADEARRRIRSGRKNRANE